MGGLLASYAATGGMYLYTFSELWYIQHTLVIISLIAYMAFTERISRAVKLSGVKAVFVIAALFAVPALTARGLDICAALFSFPQEAMYNLLSISRVVELVAWNVVMPVSLLIHSRIFGNWKEKPLFLLCTLTASCCIWSLLCIFYPSPVILWSLIGIWGAIYLGVVLVYIVRAVRGKRIEQIDSGVEQ